MSKVPVLPPSGFRDFLPEEASARAALIATITKIYQSHGFQPIGMSMLESLSTLHGKGGGTDNEKLIFKVMKRGEDLQRSLEGGKELADMGLRFDLTLPLARYCSRFREQLPKPFKVFQIGPVWRADRPQKGRFREFYQCDVDIVGSKEIGAEADCITAILEVFSELGIEGVEVHLNDRRLLAALKGSLADAQWAEALVSLDKLDKVGAEGVEKELGEKFGSVPEGISQVLKGGELANFSDIDPASVESIGEILALLKALAPGTKAVFNPTLVRGQDYYTGTIFELRHPALAGSLAGGGRYNRLLEVFGGAETPAFGGSIGFERLFLLLQESGRAAGLSQAPQVFFPLFEASLRPHLLRLAAALRRAGIRADVFPDAAKLKNQFKYADDRGIPYTAILGSDELAKGEIKVKAMSDRSEQSISIQPVETFVQRMKELCRP
jgi:histidyl-tRNA synthetase